MVSSSPGRRIVDARVHDENPYHRCRASESPPPRPLKPAEPEADDGSVDETQPIRQEDVVVPGICDLLGCQPLSDEVANVSTGSVGIQLSPLEPRRSAADPWLVSRAQPLCASVRSP